MEDTHPNKLVCRLSSSASPTALPTTASRSNRARTDSILSFTGDVCGRVIQRLGPSTCYLTRRSFKSTSKDALNDRSPAESRIRRREAETHGQMDDLVIYRLLLRHLSQGSMTPEYDCLLPLALTW